MDCVQVDQEKCIKCGLCINVCRGVLGMGSHGPEIVNGVCIGCGHCVAVCPNEAIDNTKSPLKNQIPIKNVEGLINAETASQFLRSRRSVRSYKQIPVPREEIRQLLDIARFAPTACNSQGISYHVIDNPETLRKITKVTIDWAGEELKRESSLSESPFAKNTMIQIERYHEFGKDTVLRGAPCLVIAVCDKNFIPVGRDNTHFSLSYAQLYAQAIGLATCWTGLLEFCADSGYEPLLDILKIPEDKILTGGIIVGYPIYEYKRLVDRHPLQITWQ